MGVEKVIDIIRRAGAPDVPIYIFGPKMTFTKKILDFARANFRVYSFNKYAMKYVDRDLKVSITKTVRDMLKGKKYKNVFFVDVLGVQCGKDYLNCDVLSAKKEFLYFDGGYFTLVGSRLFGRKLKLAYPRFFN